MRTSCTLSRSPKAPSRPATGSPGLPWACSRPGGGGGGRSDRPAQVQQEVGRQVPGDSLKGHSINGVLVWITEHPQLLLKALVTQSLTPGWKVVSERWEPLRDPWSSNPGTFCDKGFAPSYCYTNHLSSPKEQGSEAELTGTHPGSPRGDTREKAQGPEWVGSPFPSRFAQAPLPRGFPITSKSR